MNKSHLLAFFALVIFFSVPELQAQSVTDNNSKTLDQIVALVNDHIILKSEVNEHVQRNMYQMQQRGNRNIKFSKQMWYAVLQNMVQDYVLLDQAKVDSVEVTDEQVDRRINQRIDQTVNQLGSKEALEKRMGKSIVQMRADLRDQYRKELTIQNYRQQKLSSIKITRPEIEKYFNNIPKDSIPTIPEKVALSQIVIVTPPTNNARKQAHHLAEQLRDSVVNHGKSIEEMARKYSDGPSASNGGKIPMYPLDQLAPEYSAAAAALKPGQISKVVETSFGFHVIRLNKRQGDQIDTNHILIAINKDNYNKEAAIKKLTQIEDSVKSDSVTFADMARKDSEDPNTAPQGGRILNPQTGDRLLALEQLDPALYRIVLLLNKKGDISEPKPFTIGTGNAKKKAYRIVRLDKHIKSHTANLKDDYDAIKNSALQQKRYRFMQHWISKLKKEMYIEYKIPFPKQYASN